MQLRNTLVKLIEEHRLESVVDELIDVLESMDDEDTLDAREEEVHMIVGEHLQEAQNEVADLE